MKIRTNRQPTIEVGLYNIIGFIISIPWLVLTIAMANPDYRLLAEDLAKDVITWMSSWTMALLLDPLFFMLKLIFIEIPRYVNILP